MSCQSIPIYLQTSVKGLKMNWKDFLSRSMRWSVGVSSGKSLSLPLDPPPLSTWSCFRVRQSQGCPSRSSSKKDMNHRLPRYSPTSMHSAAPVSQQRSSGILSAKASRPRRRIRALNITLKYNKTTA